MYIQQAIFTSAETHRGSGYHLACRSNGLQEADIRELTAWGPSHDSLIDPTRAGRSTNFFPLTSGDYCVSRTVTAGEEYSNRGGWRVFTQCLVVSPADLARFANNPFAVVRAALAAGELDIPEELPQVLKPFELGGRAARVDHALLYRLASRVATDEVLRLITAAFENQRLLIRTDTDAELLLAGVINSLPIDRRGELSFTTGLRYSPQRPFRLQIIPREVEGESIVPAGTRISVFEVASRAGGKPMQHVETVASAG